jgi:hypothetical protein
VTSRGDYYYAQCVEVLRWLAHKLIWRPDRVRRLRAMPQGWPYATVRLPPGISEVAAIARTPVPAPETWVTHPLDLDIGEVADGYHLIARSISLSAKHLLFEFAFVPERTGEAEVWLNMSYGADIPPGQDYMGAGGEVQYARPALEARYAWFDFFRPDYEWYGHWDRSGQPDSDYLRNRIARLTFDLKTGEAQTEK